MTQDTREHRRPQGSPNTVRASQQQRPLKAGRPRCSETPPPGPAPGTPVATTPAGVASLGIRRPPDHCHTVIHARPPVPVAELATESLYIIRGWQLQKTPGLAALTPRKESVLTVKCSWDS